MQPCLLLHKYITAVLILYYTTNLLWAFLFVLIDLYFTKLVVRGPILYCNILYYTVTILQFKNAYDNKLILKRELKKTFFY